MNRKPATKLAADRKLALSAGKQHRARMNELLEIRQGTQQGARPDLRRDLERLRNKMKINKRECEQLERMFDLITDKASDLSTSEIAGEVRGIYAMLRGSKMANPIVLTIAGIVDDSIAYAVKKSAKGPAKGVPRVPRRFSARVEVDALLDAAGALEGAQIALGAGITDPVTVATIVLLWAAAYSAIADSIFW